jgi:putative membrane protein
MLATSLVLLGMIYLVGVVRLWRAGGYGHGIRPFEAACFGCGWLALLAALLPPLDEWSDQWLAAHIVQHELLMVIAAPLLAKSSPMMAFLSALPSKARRRVVTTVRRRMATGWTALTSPLSVFLVYGLTLWMWFLLYGLVLWVWHLPALSDHIVWQQDVKLLQQLSFFGTAALFWWGIAHQRYGRLGNGAAAVFVLATTVHSGLLGALLTFSTRMWYAPFDGNQSAGLRLLGDQQLAGLLVWIPLSVLLVVGGLSLLAAWLSESERLYAVNQRYR